MEFPTYDTIANISGNALAICTLVFFIRYFISREEKREVIFAAREEKRDIFFGGLLQENTQALRSLQEAIHEITPGRHK